MSPLLNLKVLIIESVLEQQTRYQRYLTASRDCCYQVQTVDSVADALNIRASDSDPDGDQTRPDIILLGQGGAVTSAINALQQWSTTSAIIVMGDNNLHTAVQAMKAGAADYCVQTELTPAKLCDTCYKIGLVRTSTHTTLPDDTLLQAQLPVCIDELRRARDQVSHLQHKLRTLEQTLHLGQWEFNLATQVVTWSEGLFDLLGCDSQSDLSGQQHAFQPSLDSFMALVHPDDRATVSHAIDQACQNNNVYPITYRIIRPDGTQRWIEDFAQLHIDEAEQCMKLVGIARDISQHQQTLLDLRHSEATNQAIFGAIPDLLIRMSRDGYHHQMLSGGEVKIIPSQTAIEAPSIFSVLPPEAAQRRLVIAQKVLETGQLASYEQQLDIEGTLVQEEVRITALDQDQVLVIIRDISERVRLDTERKAAEAALKRKNLLLETISAAQSQYISDADPQALMDTLLSQLLELTESEYGFIGEILYNFNHDPYLEEAHIKIRDRPYLKTHVASDGMWDNTLYPLDDAPNPTELEFQHLQTLFNTVLTTGKTVIANDPQADPQWRQMFNSYPPLKAFLGIPFFKHDRMLGMVGMVNRQGGYDEDLITFLQPFLTTCSSTIQNHRNTKLRQQAELLLYQLNEDLELRVQERTQELQSQTQLLTIILNSMGDGVLAANTRGEIILHNSAAQQMPGLGLRQDWQNLWGIYLPDGTPCGMDQLPLIRAMQGESLDQLEIVLRNARHSDPIYIEVTARPLTDGNGCLIGGLAVFRDVTSRKQAEQAVRLSQEQLQLAVESSGDGLWDWNMVTGETYLSPRWLGTLGYEVGDLPGHFDTWKCLLHPDDEPWLMEILQNHITDNSIPYRVEYRARCQSGDWKWVENYGKVVSWDANGRPLRMVGLQKDISDRKRVEAALQLANAQLAEYSHTLEQRVEARTQELKTAQQQMMAQEKLASLGTLTAGVAHEIRNPLNFVKNYAEGSVELGQELRQEIQQLSTLAIPETLALIEDLVSDIEENAQAIRRHGQRAEKIIEGMMQHAHTDSDRATPQATDLHDLLDQAIKLAYHIKRVQDNAFNLSIRTDYDPTLRWVDMIPANLSRAFINLLDNACDAMRTKQQSLSTAHAAYVPTLVISTQAQGDYAEIRIRDNGCGIKTEAKAKILVPFFTTKPPGQGTGLGLSLTHDIIVNQHQGSLQIETEVDQFTEVTVLLPCKQPAQLLSDSVT